jgi:4-alpha-glucanotransferase
MRALHDSHDRRYRDPFGARPCGETVTLRLMVSDHEPVPECLLCVRRERSGALSFHPMKAIHHEDRGTVFETTLTLPAEPDLVWYYFRLRAGDTVYHYHQDSAGLGGVGILCSLPEWEDAFDAQGRSGPGPLSAPKCLPYQITVYKPSVVPLWWKRGTVYQIYVDRFFNGNPGGKVLNPKKKALIHAHWDDTPLYIRDEKGRVARWDFFGGNLAGVIAKLPYLEELGVSAIYLNPIFESASNHKYDTGDYLKIDPMYGGLETFVRLTALAEKRGISVILDGVFSHTGADSRYFNKYGHYPELGAFQAEISPYYPWYRLDYPGGPYECWWGEEDLPNVNEMEPSYQEFMLGKENGVARFWLRKGARGWRLDVADELPDEFIRRLRIAVKETDPEAVLIGEVWEDASNKVSYGERREYFLGEELDSVMNYPLRDILLKYMLGRGSASNAVARLMSLCENYPPQNFRAAMNLIGSHDRIRVLTLLGDAPAEGSLSPREREDYRLSPPAREKAVRRLKLMVLLQMTLPGVPCVYYGDEAGLEGYSDPYNRGTYPWGREDREILEWHKKVIWLRNEYDVLKEGEFRPFWVGDDILGFRSRSVPRADEKVGSETPGPFEEIIVSVNRNRFRDTEFDLALDAPHRSSQDTSSEDILVLELLSGERVHPHMPGPTIKCSLGPLEAKVYYVSRRRPGKTDSGSSRFSSSNTPFPGRACGILLHLTSLPSRWGIGDMGKEARRFVDFLASAGQGLWQILPLNPIGRGNSPYSSPSVMAGNPLLISPDLLLDDGLLTEEDVRKGLERLARGDGEDRRVADRVNYPLVAGVKERLFRKAWARFRKRLRPDGTPRRDNPENRSFQAFIEENRSWLMDYCLFMALKKKNNGLPWVEWDEALAKRVPEALDDVRKELKPEIQYQLFLQYVFQRQWQSLKEYAGSKGVRVVGDIPIYADSDSSDTWAHRALFNLDDTGRPEGLAGVPPDYFSTTGQLWGNPVYNWREMEKDGYAWWRARVRRMLSLHDYVRLDHFRGFEAFWEVPAGQKTAEKGRWLKGPGKRFFQALREEFGDLPFIAEDLGYITPEVRNLRNIVGLPGMKVFQFEVSPGEACREVDVCTACSPREEPDPPRLAECVYYSGTHDNDTLIGWCAGEIGVDGLSPEEKRGLSRRILRQVYLSEAMWVIVPFQDVLGLGSEARMNTPGTATGNWEWRMRDDDLGPLEPVSHQGDREEADRETACRKSPARWLRDVAVESLRVLSR